MELKNKLYNFIRLLKYLYPVRIDFDLEVIIIEEAEHNGNTYFNQSPYTEAIDWEQVIDNYNNHKQMSFQVEDNHISVSLSPVSLSDIPIDHFKEKIQDVYSKAVRELNKLTKDNITYEVLFDLKQLIEEKNNNLNGFHQKVAGIIYEVIISKELKDDIPIHLQIGDIQKVFCNNLLSNCKKEITGLTRFLESVIQLLDDKMVQIPKVRTTILMKEYILQDELESFERLEECLTEQGKLTPDGLNMEKKESTSLLYSLARSGYIKRMHYNESSVNSYRKKVRLAFEEHFNTGDLTEQAKPSKFKNSKVSIIKLGIDDFLIKEGKNLVNDNPLGL